jgi:hypothetical protein
MYDQPTNDSKLTGNDTKELNSFNELNKGFSGTLRQLQKAEKKYKEEKK